jgi:hypothetical protein
MPGRPFNDLPSGGKPGVPVNGAVGQATQTPANQLVSAPQRIWAWNGGGGSAMMVRRRRKKRTKRKAARRAAPRRSRKSRKRARLVKGSLAAKRYMAKLRAKRK